MNSKALRLAIGGLSVLFEPISESNRESLEAGSYYELDWISEVLRHVLKRGDIVVDAGANTGLWSLPLAMHVGPSGHVYAFEPEPVACSALSRNSLLNTVSIISVSQSALASNNSMRTFFVRPETEMHSFYSATVRPFDQSLTRRIEVQAERLDSLVFAGIVRQPNFIKIDVEGAELEVLEGLSGICSPIRAILIEIHRGPLEFQGSGETLVRKLLESFGFTKIQRLGEIHLLATRG